MPASVVVILSSESYHYIETYGQNEHFTLLLSCNPSRSRPVNNCYNAWPKWFFSRLLSRLGIKDELVFFLGYVVWLPSSLLLLLAARFRFDVKAVIIPSSGYQAPAVFARIMCLKVIVDAVNLLPNKSLNHFSNNRNPLFGLLHSLRYLSALRLVTNAHALISPSSHVARGYNYTCISCKIIPYPSVKKPLNYVHDNISKNLQSLELSGILRIGVVGAISPRKNQLLLAQSLVDFIDSGLPTNVKHICLDLVGTTDTFPPIVDSLNNLASPKLSINIHGHLPRHSFDRLILSWHVYAQPSVSEGFAVSMIDAWVFGLPIIASVDSGAQDFLDSKSVFILDQLDSQCFSHLLHHICDNISIISREAETRVFKLHSVSSYQAQILKYIDELDV